MLLGDYLPRQGRKNSASQLADHVDEWDSCQMGSSRVAHRCRRLDLFGAENTALPSTSAQ
ncbi:hypothetical protein yrohd0001_12440 [Yersinia rohdei ATCC 43380]|nr:hypothetical protein yrohd0001_12440 [Yersinia rohdei ATCC 43380]